MENQSNSLCMHVQCCAQAISMRFLCVARVHEHYRMPHQYWLELIKSPVAINHIPKCQGPVELISRVRSISGNSHARHYNFSDCATCSVMHGFLDARIRNSKSPEPLLSPQIIRVFLDKVDRVIGHTIVSSILVPSLVLSNEKWKVVSSHS